jgi:hypothetical protein
VGPPGHIGAKGEAGVQGVDGLIVSCYYNCIVTRL